MPYANNQGIRIHYQVQGDGFPLVLHHGITQSWIVLPHIVKFLQTYINEMEDRHPG